VTGRPGFALIYALLTTMALSLVALGIMARGRAEVEIARAVADHARARAAAETTALDLAEAWSTRAHADLPVGATAPPPAAPPAAHSMAAVTATVTRLDSALFLLRVESRLDGGRPAPVTAAAGLLVRVLHPPALLSPFPAAVTALRGVELHGGEVNGEDPCGDTVAAIQAPAVRSEGGARTVGDPPVLLAAPADAPSLDPFAPTLGATLATLVLRGGTHLPRPLADPTGCIDDDRNWGSLSADHPCHGLLPYLLAAAPITIAGGQGRGVLVVDGDARFRNGARFSGVVVVHGTLSLEDGSEVRGAVRADSVVVVDGSVHRDHCEISTALTAPALDRAFRSRDRWWVPVF